MGGPAEQTTNTVFIPPGEGRQTFAPLPLAWLVENLEIGADGILESVVGPSILRIKTQVFLTVPWGADADVFEGQEINLDALDTTDWPENLIDEEVPATGRPNLTGLKSGEPLSIFSAPLLNGSARMLLYRIGSRMYTFNGDHSQPDDVLITGLAVDTASKNLDQYVVLNDKIVYFNGTDAPRVITYDNNVTPLGFDRRASTPSISSPSQADFDDAPNYYPNAMGYSWQGRIGTPGDELTGRKASLLKGAWYYYFQYEDINGNLSEFSIPSDPATIHTNQAEPFLPPAVQTNVGDESKYLFGGGRPKGKKSFPMGAEIDDLTRRFLVKAPGDLPDHAVATRIFRTPDTYHKDPTPKLVARVPGSRQFYFDDNNADSDLGVSWTETISVPVFRVACAHQGRLIIGNVSGAPGIVRRSQIGFPGTFEKDDYIYPDSSGAEITALASHNGNLIAFTESSTYLIGNDFQQPQPLSLGIGCTAPKSIQSLRDGSLVWLGSDGVYTLKPGGGIQKISTPIDKVFDRELNKSQFFRSASVIDYETGEYRCAVASKGYQRNDIVLCFDGTYWRRQTLGIQIADMCTLADHTHTTVAVGADPREQFLATELDTSYEPFNGRINLARIFVLNKQSTDYFAPPRRIRYRSAWIRSGDYGLVPTNVRNLYVGLLDAWVGKATIRLFRNGSWKPISVMDDLLLYGPDDESGIVADVASKAIVGEARTRDPRIFWRQIPVDIQNANSWAFEIEILGSPAPKVPGFGSSGSTLKNAEQSVWESLFGDPELGKAEFDRRLENDELWELGRLKIAAFAFDTSVATQGAPLGRVPFRQDK